MSRRRMRVALPGALGIATALAACGDPAPPASTRTASSLATEYLTDATARRAALVASLVNPNNGYSALRLAHYDTGDAEDWSLLPESNPRVEVVAASELDAPKGVAVGGSVGPSAKAITIGNDALRGDMSALLALGEDAFFHYPVEQSLQAETATASRAEMQRYGFWVDETRGAGGLVREETPDGGSVLSYTCSTCHAAGRPSGLVIGVGNDALDLGLLTVNSTPGIDDETAGHYLAWGPGRLDVTTNDGTEPVRIGETRTVAWLGYLQADATVKIESLVSVAIRIETLIITSHGQVDRPPRALSLGLAAYLTSLGSSIAATTPTTAAETHGATLFASQCESCHTTPGYTGAPIALDLIGTDPTVGLSAERGTGMYAVPSLHGVSTRGALLHDASLPSLAAMFDPARTSATYTGGRRGPGAIPGHVFGLALSAADRADLVAYLETL